MGYQPTVPHPIEEELVKRARHEHSREYDDIGDLETVHETLDDVQEIIQSGLRDLHQEAVLGSERIEAWGETQKETSEKYVFIGSFDRYWKRVFESANVTGYSVQQIVKDAHRWQTERYGITPEEDAIVVAKPIVWSHGQSTARTELRDLLQKGLTPAEALDLWFTEYGSGPLRTNQSLQANRRGVSQQAVNNNVSKAREKLEQQQTIHLNSLDPYTDEQSG